MTESLIRSPLAVASAQHMRGWRLAGAAFCCLMFVLHVAAGLHSAGVTDFWRDIYWSTLIAHGERFPPPGPPINQVVELGPWWYYLLALPIFLTGRIAAAAVTIQALAALKYFLAWCIGTRLLDARFGFAFAVCMAVAGWSTVPFLFPSHPAVVETTLLLLALATLRLCANLSAGNALLFGLAAAACVHAHPTTLPYLVVAGGAVLWRHRSASALALLGLAAVVVLLSLLPPWLDPEPIDELLRRSWSDYAANDVGNGFAQRLPKFIAGLLVGGAWNGLLLLTPWRLATVKLAWWIYCVCLAIALAGVAALSLHATALRRWLAAAALLLGLQILFVLGIRGWTAIWMLPSCLPPLAFIVAAGWYEWLAAPGPRVRRVALPALLVSALLSIAPFGFFLRDLHGVRVAPNANYFNVVGSPDGYVTVPGSPLSVRQIDALGAELCTPANLHARLATAIDKSLATSARNACGTWPDLLFGGQRAGAHLAGIPQRLAATIGIAPDKTVGGLALYSHVRAIAPATGSPRPRLDRMRVGIDIVGAQPAPLAYDFTTGPDDVVVLTNRRPQTAMMTVHEVEANGAPAQKLYEEGNWQVYRCAVCSAGAAANWQLRLDAVEAILDLVVLEKVPASAAR
ncbi:hypothetical protein [Rudaea sp.]|uniref:hypothetical protein n=1 Tax=Rudaea sp. TaxID=2136325 RepID=UPI002ED08A31